MRKPLLMPNARERKMNAFVLSKRPLKNLRGKSVSVRRMSNV